MRGFEAFMVRKNWCMIENVLFESQLLYNYKCIRTLIENKPVELVNVLIKWKNLNEYLNCNIMYPKLSSVVIV